MRSIICLFLICLSPAIWAQDHYNYISSRLTRGSILLHSKDLRAIESSYPLGLEVDFGRHKISESAWNNCNCFPKTGVSVTFWDFDNREVLGYGLTTMYYVQPVFGAKRDLSFSVRAAAGFSYQSKPYDAQSNPDNLSYSTYLAVSLQLGVAAHYRFSELWSAEVNAVFNHISNGGLKEPNKGINWPAISIGVGKYLTYPEFPEREKADWKNMIEDKNRWDITAFGTYHQPVGGLFYISAGMEIKYAHRISRLSNISAGTEWMYDLSKVKLAEEGKNVNGNNLGLALGHEFILGKFLFGQQFAVYMIKPESQLADVYQRYSLVYRISPQISFGTSLKVHGHVADFADIRIAYSF